MIQGEATVGEPTPGAATQDSATPDVSILIVTYKCRDEARDCLASIYGQEHGVSFETLVLDNDSGDGTVEMVRSEFPQATLVPLDENIGFAAGMAFSENQNQLRKHGSAVLDDGQEDLERPLQSIAVWAKVNTWAADYGEQTLGDRYLQVRFEDLCSDPGVTARRVFDFFGLEGDAEGMAEKAVRPPSTLGRWRDEKSDTVRGLHEVAGPALARFGYV